MKKIISMIIAILLFASAFTMVYAASDEIVLTPNKSSYTAGEEIIITVDAKSEDKVAGISAGLSYDSSKLQLVEITPATGVTNKSQESSINLELTDTTSAKQTITLGTIKFKVLTTLTASATTVVNLSDSAMILIDDDNLRGVVTLDQDAKANISISIGSTGGTVTIEDDEVETIEDIDDDDDGKAKVAVEEEKEEEILQTGTTLNVVLAIIALVSLGTISYIKYKKLI